MYYKLLNKTLLTSALISLIYLNAHQSYAQEIIFEGDDVDISLPDVGTPSKDDVIPLENQGIIVPEQKKPAVKAKNPSDFELDENSIPSPFDQKDVKSEKPAKKPAVEEKTTTDGKNQAEIKQPAPKTPAPAAKNQKAGVRPPAKQPGNQVPAPKNQVQQRKTQPANQPQNGKNESELKFGDSVLAQTNNELFNQMSDIEKQTTLLTLELKREKIRNEVEAAKAVRERAEQEKLAAEEAKKRQEIEWQKEQEAKVIREQIALKEKEIEFEKLKQRKALTAYMNAMLAQKQAWIEESSKLYNEIEELTEKNKTVRQSYKNDLTDISKQSAQLLDDVKVAKNNHDRIVSSLTAQNAQLRKRIEANEEAAKRGGKGVSASNENGDLSSSADDLIRPINISKEYAIMEIIGQGDELLVKLINKEGDSFMAKIGTVLQTGHMVEEIRPNYVQFDRNGLKDFLYVSTSTLNAEPNNAESIAGKSTGEPAGNNQLTVFNPSPVQQAQPTRDRVTTNQVVEESPVVKRDQPQKNVSKSSHVSVRNAQPATQQESARSSSSRSIVGEKSMPSLGSSMFVK